MPKFTFRLQKLLNLREWQEKQVAEALSSARRRADEARTARDTLRSFRERSSGELARFLDSSGSAGQLQYMSNLIARLDEGISGAEERCLEAEGEVKGLRGEYQVRFRKRRTLDRLREHAHEQWKTDQNQSEQKVLDEIAVTRFSRGASVIINGTAR
jgi:flagellar FliJ protein